MVNKVDKIYVLNHKDFTDRLEIIENNLNREGLEYKLVQVGHPDTIDYESELEGWEHYDDIIIQQPYDSYRNFSKKISVGSLSLILKHLWCYKDQIENNYENVLILEDDCDIPENFSEYLSDNMRDFSELNEIDGVGVLVMGTSHNFLCKNIKEGKSCHYGLYQKTRCTHAYILNINSTSKILERFKIINLPIDFKLNEILQLEGIKVAWSEPGLEQNDESRTNY